MIKTVNNKIATEPFPEQHLKITVQKGFGVPEQSGSVQALAVLFPTSDDKYKPGDVIYVPAELCKHPLASKVMVLDEKKCILIEENMVLACQKDS